jgi:hypothetical protein
LAYVLKGAKTDNRITELRDINRKLYESQLIKFISKQRSKRDAMDNLIYELVDETEKDAIELDYDKSNIKAESVRHRLDERIEQVDLVLTHLKDIRKHFESVHKMAKTLVESEVTADFVKKFAIEQLNDSVNKVEKCDSCWS